MLFWGTIRVIHSFVYVVRYLEEGRTKRLGVKGWTEYSGGRNGVRV